MNRILYKKAKSIRLALALAACLPAAAWGWSVPLDGAAGAVPVVQTVANANGQYWVGSGQTTPRVVRRYDAGGAAPAALGTYDALASTFALKHVTDQGDLIAVTDLGLVPQCKVVKFAANGTLRWKQDIACTASSGGPARVWPAGTDGSVWAHAELEWLRLGSDGRVLHRLAADAVPGEDVAVDPRNGTLYALVVERDPATQTPTRTTLTAYDRQGAQQWRKPLDAPVRVAVAHDGTLRVAGIKDGLFVAALNADGTQRWSTIVDASVPSDAYANLRAPLVDADGASRVAFDLSAATAAAAAKLDANGRTLWRVTRGDLALGAETLHANALAPNSDLLLAHGDRVSRIDANGRVRYVKRLARPVASSAPTLANLVAFEADGASVVNLVDYGTGENGVLARLDVNGNALAAPAPGNVSGKAAARRTTLADGSVAVWTMAQNGTRELSRIGAGGGTIWRRATAGSWIAPTGFNSLPSGAMAAGRGAVCTLDARRNGEAYEHALACYRGDDGGESWSRVLEGDAGDGSFNRAQLHVAADGTVSAWYEAGTDVVLKRYDATGVMLATKTFAGAALHETAPSNAAFALLGAGTDAELALRVSDAAGTERYRFKPTYDASFPAAATFDVDGGLVVVGLDRASSRGLVVRYAANGDDVWSRPIESTSYDFQPPVIATDAVYLASCCGGPPSALTQQVMRFKLADGALVWQRDLRLPAGSAMRSAALALSPAGDALAAVGAPGRTLDIDVLAMRDGSLRASRREACRGEGCVAVAPVAVGARVNVLAASTGGASLIDWTVPARDMRIDQPGIAGAWWSPYANGEGLVIDYLPASRTFFAPWFTFSRDGGNDPAGQRWYVVQGAVPVNATSVELPITESTGGNFDALPTVQARIVGKATLTFTDCNNGTMRYAFDAATNGAASGTITLTRLTPTTQSCLLADGTTQLGTSAPPANGFDANQSGSWFEPATSGQGLQFVVQPGGLFFAPWFTFDPAGPSDDPDRQRWFTLQGSVADARNGVVQAPIVQTIGGAFDRVPTNNMTIVGTATVTFTACDKAKVDYRFDDSAAAGAMRALAGSTELVKIGGCAP